ncbi:unnamed protein product [Ilex paraguariensis]|uniref:Myb/SANT-like domain-containing protein n=1 Tax=Ilex paraguariensis TaxID=185542 RepID=A0ABC8RVM9_9AQUA
MDLEVPCHPKGTTTFEKDAWNIILVQLSAKTGYNYNFEQLQNKYNTLRLMYSAFKKLLNETTGVGWDPERQTITLSDDVWKNLCKVNKHARQFKKKGCPHYDKLGRIFGKTSAIGEHAHPSTLSSSNSEEEKDPIYDPSNEVDKGNDNENAKGPSNRSRSRSTTSTCSRRRKKNSVMVGLTVALNVLVENSKKKMTI